MATILRGPGIWLSMTGATMLSCRQVFGSCTMNIKMISSQKQLPSELDLSERISTTAVKFSTAATNPPQQMNNKLSECLYFKSYGFVERSIFLFSLSTSQHMLACTYDELRRRTVTLHDIVCSVKACQPRYSNSQSVYMHAVARRIGQVVLLVLSEYTRRGENQISDQVTSDSASIGGAVSFLNTVRIELVPVDPKL